MSATHRARWAWAMRLVVAVMCIALPRAGWAQSTCATATTVSVGVEFEGSNVGSPGDGLAGLCAPTAAAVWHQFTPTVTGNHTISLCGSSVDTVAALYAACGTTPLACDDNTCGTGSLIVAPLMAGTTYRLRVATVQGTSPGAYRLLITAPSLTPPGNNACGAATQLTSNVPLRGTNLGANGNDQSLCGALDTTDVWFSFSPALSGSHRVEVCATGFAPVVTIHTTCIGGTSSTCSTDAPVFAPCPGRVTAGVTFNATAGRVVLIRVAGQRGSFGTFDIVAYAPRNNDLCTGALPVPPNGTTNGSTSPILTNDTQVSCTISGADVWHSFVPQDSGPHYIALCDSNFDTVLSIHSGCPGSPGASVLACNDDICGVQSSFTLQLMAGEQYLIRIAGKGSAPAWGSYALLVARLAPQNNLCTNATPISVNTPVQGSTIGADGTDLTPSCGTEDTKDVWYSFTPPATAGYEMHTCGSVMDTTLSVFNSCAVTAAACSDNDPTFCGGSSSNSRLSVQLTAGVPVLVRVAGVGNTEGNFTLSIARTPPSNDSCTAPMVLPAGTVLSGTVTQAAGSGAGTCVSSDAPDAWFVFTPPTTTFWQIDTCGSVLRGSVSIYSSCPPAAPLACGGAGFASCPTGQGAAATAYLSAGTPYLVRVANQPGATTGGAFQIVAQSVAPPNDACADALPITVGSNNFSANVGAAVGTPLAPCATGDTRDVWFSFVPGATGTYQIGTCTTGGTLDTVLTLHESCGGPPILCSDNQAGCDAGGSLLTVRLTAGAQYLIRVAGVGGSEGTFFVTASVGVPSNDACQTAQTIITGEVMYDTLGATTDSAFLDLTCTVGFNLINNDVWFRFTPASTGLTTASVCASNFDTAIAVSSAANGCPSGLYSVLACNDDSACVPGVPQTTLQSEVTWNAVGGVPYFIRVGSRLGEVGSGILRITGSVATCPCDWNGVGGLNIQDLLEFIEDWILGQGDFNGNGQSSIEDIFDFIGCYLDDTNGC